MYIYTLNKVKTVFREQINITNNVSSHNKYPIKGSITEEIYHS